MVDSQECIVRIYFLLLSRVFPLSLFNDSFQKDMSSFFRVVIFFGFFFSPDLCTIVSLFSRGSIVFLLKDLDSLVTLTSAI